MKLIKCYINNFGKLSDFSFDFSEDITVINEENGFGKSTFCAFIKAMFYGFNNTRTKKIADNERMKFTPWQGGIFGGYIDFSIENKEYRIERSFSQKQSDDEFSLYDLKTGLKSNDFTENIGEEIFGIDLKSFERCIYYQSLNTDFKVPISLSSKISSLINDTDDLANYDTAVENLTKRSRQYQTIGNKGLLPQLKEKISELQNNLYEIKKAEQTLELNEIEIDRLKENKKNSEKELENIHSLIFENSEVSVVKQKIMHYNSLVSKCKDEKEKIEFYENKYGENMPSDKEIDEISIKNEKVKLLKEKSFSKIGHKVLSLITVVFWILFVVGIIYTLTTGIGFKKTEYTSLIFIFAIIAIGIDIYLSVSKYKRNREINKSTDELSKMLLKYKLDTNDTDKVINELRNDLFAYNNAKNEYQEFFIKAKNYYKEENLKSFKENIKSKTPEELKKKEAEVRKDIDNISSEIIILSEKSAKLSLAVDKKLEVEQRIDSLSNKFIEFNENYQAILKAIELLKTAKENLSVKYKSRVEESFKNYISLFLNQKFDEAMLNTELDVCISDKGAIRDLEYFSSGTKSIIEFASRMALIDVVFEKEKPFIILDDVFAMVDDSTFVKLKELLKTIADKYQVIYFTCSSSRIL